MWFTLATLAWSSSSRFWIAYLCQRDVWEQHPTANAPQLNQHCRRHHRRRLPPTPAAHACLASRQNAVRIRLDNQRRSTFRLAQPQGPLFLLTAALQSAAVKPKSESSRTGEKKKSVRRFAAAGTNPHSPGSSEQRSEVNERYGSGSPAHKSLWEPGVYGGGRPNALKHFSAHLDGLQNVTAESTDGGRCQQPERSNKREKRLNLTWKRE